MTGTIGMASIPASLDRFVVSCDEERTPCRSLVREEVSVDGQGETLGVPERVIVAPALGAFRPFRSVENRVVSAGQPLGVVEGLRDSIIVRSPFAGR